MPRTQPVAFPPGTCTCSMSLSTAAYSKPLPCRCSTHTHLFARRIRPFSRTSCAGSSPLRGTFMCPRVRSSCFRRLCARRADAASTSSALRLAMLLDSCADPHVQACSRKACLIPTQRRWWHACYTRACAFGTPGPHAHAPLA